MLYRGVIQLHDDIEGFPLVQLALEKRTNLSHKRTERHRVCDLLDAIVRELLLRLSCHARRRVLHEIFFRLLGRRRAREVAGIRLRIFELLHGVIRLDLLGIRDELLAKWRDHHLRDAALHAQRGPLRDPSSRAFRDGLGDARSGPLRRCDFRLGCRWLRQERRNVVVQIFALLRATRLRLGRRRHRLSRFRALPAFPLLSSAPHLLNPLLLFLKRRRAALASVHLSVAGSTSKDVVVSR
eukprot:scaffold7403_cov277-Pinguiococcus_pyrenoidosus.AAC.13